MSETQRIVLPGDGERASEESDPTIVIEEGIREITDTTLADSHAPASQIRAELESKNEDWGDGFYVSPEPVLVTRNQDGSIARTTPLSEIPGVHFEGGKLRPDEPMEVEERPTPVPLGRDARHKLTEILALRLFNYWRERGPQDPRYNPFRDGIPELPAGSPEHLQPLPGTPLYPATDGQIMAYARKFVGERTSVIEQRRFGKGQLQDLAIRIER